VIDRVEALGPLPFDAETYGEDILANAVLSPLFTEGAVANFAVYFGRMRTVGIVSPFSFFPARLPDDPEPLFTRPQLMPVGPLEGIISPENMQGINNATVSPAERDAIWHEVTRQVVGQGCALGCQAVAPPLVPHTSPSPPHCEHLHLSPEELDTVTGGGNSSRSELRPALMQPQLALPASPDTDD